MRLSNGAPAIVKALTPISVKDDLRGVHHLKWHEWHGAIRVLAMKANLLLLSKRTIAISARSLVMRWPTPPYLPSRHTDGENLEEAARSLAVAQAV